MLDETYRQTSSIGTMNTTQHTQRWASQVRPPIHAGKETGRRVNKALHISIHPTPGPALPESAPAVRITYSAPPRRIHQNTQPYLSFGLNNLLSKVRISRSSITLLHLLFSPSQTQPRICLRVSPLAYYICTVPTRSRERGQAAMHTLILSQRRQFGGDHISGFHTENNLDSLACAGSPELVI